MLWIVLLVVVIPIITVALALIIGSPANPSPSESASSELEPTNETRRSDAPILHFVARDGERLAYRRYNVGSEPDKTIVVMLHGISATSVSLDPLARFLSDQEYDVICPDLRGHGGSGSHGQINYIGQYEHDLDDLVSSIDSKNGNIHLVGFSAGGGLAIRVAGAESIAQRFSSFLFLTPLIGHDAPTIRNDTGFTEVGMPRIIALIVLNKLNIKFFNNLVVLKLVPEQTDLYDPTVEYSFSTIMNLRPQMNYLENIASIRKPFRVLVGSDDDVFHADQFDNVFIDGNKPNSVEIVDGMDHIDLLFNPDAHTLVLERLRELNKA